MATHSDVQRRLVLLFGGAIAALLAAYLFAFFVHAHPRYLVSVFLGVCLITAYYWRLHELGNRHSSLTTQPLPIDEAEALFQRRGNGEYYMYRKWQRLQSQMRRGDQLVRYSEVEVLGGYPSGEEGIALLRRGRIVSEIPLTFIG